MDKNTYWALIEAAAHKHPNDEDTYYNYLKEKLAALTYRERYRFSQFTAHYLAHADCAGVMMLCKVLDGYFTDDSLLYFTLWVLSRGKRFYLTALENPDLLAAQLPQNSSFKSFEDFLSLGFDLEEENEVYTDREILSWALSPSEADDISSEIKYWNGEAADGYPTIAAMIADIPNALPALCQKFNFVPRDTPLQDKDDLDEMDVAAATDAPSGFERFTRQLEAELNTSRAVTEKWKADMLLKVSPKTVGSSHHLQAIWGEDTFLIDNLSIRKKKFPCTLIGYNIVDETTCTFYEGADEMLYRFLGKTNDEIFIAGSYRGGISRDEVDRFFVNILIFDSAMTLEEEIILSCAEEESLRGGCHQEGKLFLWFRETTHTPNHAIQNRVYILEFDLETRRVTRRLENASRPLPATDGIYYLRENPAHQQAGARYNVQDLYHYHPERGEHLILERVSNFTTAGEKLVAVQLGDDNHSTVKLLDRVPGTQTVILRKGDCEIINLSATDKVVAFDIFAIDGDSTFDKLTVFYHLQRGEYRIMEAKFLAQNIVGMGFCKVQGDHYYGESVDYSDPGARLHNAIVCRGDLRKLFA